MYLKSYEPNHIALVQANKSEYDNLSVRLTSLLRIRNFIVGIPVTLVVVCLVSYLSHVKADAGMVMAWMYLVPLAGIVSVGFFYWLLNKLISPFKKITQEIHGLEERIRFLSKKVLDVFAKYKDREKGQTFKSAFGGVGKKVADFEESLCVGMSKEKKEVWLTAFCRNGIVIKVTARIGSARRCKPADDPRNWREYIKANSCDEVRQYHNHPVCTNWTLPSPEDRKTHSVLKNILDDKSYCLKSLIVFWNKIHEWRVLEYNEHTLLKLDSVMDASKI